MSESQCLMLSFPSGPEAGVRGTRDKTLTWCGKPSTDTDQSHIFLFYFLFFTGPLCMMTACLHVYIT